MKTLQPFLKPALFLVLSVIFAIFTKTLLWVPSLILAIFFAATDILRVDQRTSVALDMKKERGTHELGVLGEYVVDSTSSYGLFLMLLNAPVFVDIRRDEQLEDRKMQALFLFKHSDSLETNLRVFLDRNPEYISKQMTYIGLHTKEIDQAEIFWEPEGHTRLLGLKFVLD